MWPRGLDIPDLNRLHIAAVHYRQGGERTGSLTELHDDRLKTGRTTFLRYITQSGASINMINKDTTIKFSKLGKKAGPIGACMLSRSKLLGLL